MTERTSTPPIDPLLGATFGGKYRIIEKLGAGGMGGVYKAEHLLMNRFVALKVLRNSLLHDELLLKRFQHEARAASQFSHPNAITLYDYGVENGVPFLVMEFVEGQTLKRMLEHDAPLPLERVKNILRQICSALNEAHKRRIIHRDIKPDNVMVRPVDGVDEVKVLDFGVSKSINVQEFGADANLTQAGTLVGTPQYAAPEQCRGQDLDVRSDIYSLGTLTYEMLSGQLPFRGSSLLQLLMDILNEPPQPLQTAKPELGIPGEVDAVVLRALEKDRDRRYSSAMEFYEAFSRAVDGVPRDGEERPSSPKRFRPGLALGFAAAVVVLLLVWRAALVPPFVEQISEDKAAILKEAADKIEAERARVMAEAERMKRDAEKRMREQEAAQMAEVKRQAEAARRAEEEKTEALRQAELAKAEAELQAEALRVAEAEQEQALRLEQEAARQAEVEKVAAIQQAEFAKAEAKRLAELATKAETARDEAVRKMESVRSAVAAGGEEKEAGASEGGQIAEVIRRAKENEAQAVRKAEEMQREAARQAHAARRAASEAERLRGEAAAKAKELAARMEAARTAAKDDDKRRAELPTVPTGEEQARRQQPETTAAQTREPKGESALPADKKRRRCGPTWCL